MNPGDRLDEFEIIEPLGEGGMGHVYLARDTTLKRQVAVKMISESLGRDAEALARFQREAVLLAAVEHPNIAAIYRVASAQHAGRTVRYLVLERVEGETLAARLRSGPMQTDEAVRIASQIARALQAAHRRAVIHRDLKPANVMITPRGRVKVLDFGIAKALAPSVAPGDSTATPTQADVTAAGALIGTAPYMSPEQIRGAEVDARTDVWAFGCVLYEMLTGERAFAGETGADVMGAILEREPDDSKLPADTPASLRSLLRRCLQKQPQRRLRDIGDARLELEDSQGTAGARDAGSEDGPGATDPSRHFWLPVAAMLAAAAVAVAAWQLATFMGRDPRSTVASTAGIASLVALPTTLEGAASEMLLIAPLTLSNYLSEIPDLEVHFPPSQTEIDRFASNQAGLARAYDVDAFVMLSARQTDGRTVLQVQLVDPASRRLLWGRGYAGEVPLGELLQQAATGLRLALRPNEAATQDALEEPLQDSEALQNLRLGQVYSRDYNHSRHLPTFERAKSAFEQALQLDPGLGDAAAHLALLYRYLWESTHDENLVDQIDSWTQLANETSPDSAMSVVMQAIQQGTRGPDEFRASIATAARAAATGTREPIAHLVLGAKLGTCSVAMALPPLEQSVAADPLNLMTRTQIAAMYMWLGQDERAGDDLGDVLALEPDGPVFVIAAVLLALDSEQGPEPELLEQLRHFAAEDEMVAWQQRATQAVADMHSTDRAGNADGFARAFSRLRDEVPQMTQNFGPEIVAAAVQVLARAGMIEEAAGLLRGHDDWRIPYDWYTEHPALVPLREHPDFQQAAGQARARCDQTIEVLTPLRDTGELPDYLEGPFDDLLEHVRSGESVIGA